MTRRRRPWLALAVVAGLAACAGGDDSDSGVASLDASETEAASDQSDGAEPGDVDSGELEDAYLQFVRCIRDRGVDLPEPTGGDFTIVGPGPEMEARYPGYGEAYEACIPIVEEVAGSFEMNSEEIADLQDHMLAVAQCMRDNGYDYPDPQFGDDGLPTASEPGESGLAPDDTDQLVDDLNDCADEVTNRAEGSSDDGAEEA